MAARAIIIYPTHASHVTNGFTVHDLVTEELVEWRGFGPPGMPERRRILMY
jgi:hypothetical protein